MILVAAVLVAVLLRTFVVQTYYIPSVSMTPTLQVGDRIIVDKLAYRFHGVGRGDIVVFARPPAENCGGPPVGDLVKRVIGLPGETVSATGGHVDINGKPLPEPYLNGVSTANFGPVKVPASNYFMMGDNRPYSCDSRDWGTVPRSLIVGKVVLRIWPITRFHFF